MKKNIAEKWVAALRSGEYKQGWLRLRTENPQGQSFCCLGVLANLHRQEDPNFYPEWGCATLDESTRRWAGMAWSSGEFPPDLLPPGARVSPKLWSLNDQARWSFNQIADFIEKNWEAL